MDEHDPREVEEAFRHLWRVGPVGEDWAAQAALLARHPAVAEVAVIGVPGGRLGERVCAAIVARDRHAAADPADLRSFLEAQRIARQKIPEEFLVVDELPRTPAGKVQKFLLVERWEDGRVDGGSRGA